MSHRVFFPALLLCSLGCVPQFRTDVVAANRVSFAPVADPSTLVAEVALTEVRDGEHVLRYVVHLPRALELAYEVRCPSGADDGVLGETFAAYRERRLAELEEERRRQAAMVGSLVGVGCGVQAVSITLRTVKTMDVTKRDISSSKRECVTGYMRNYTVSG